MNKFTDLTTAEQIRFSVIYDYDNVRYLGEITTDTLEQLEDGAMREALLDYPQLIADALHHERFGVIDNNGIAFITVRAFKDNIPVKFVPEDPKDAEIRKQQHRISELEKFNKYLEDRLEYLDKELDSKIELIDRLKRGDGQ